MTTIWKYKLPLMDLATIRMPRKGKILCVHEQRGNVYLWVEVPEGIADITEERSFRIVGTGHKLNTRHLAYVGTVFLHAADLVGANLVFHVFQVLQ